MQRYDIIRNAKLYKEGISVAVSRNDEQRVAIAQAADELLGITGISASFVLSVSGDNINISARSIGKVNVQLIVEKLGGGGNQSIAGGTLKGVTIEEAAKKLYEAIDDYLIENS